MKTNVNPPSIDQVLFLIRRIINELASEPTKTKVAAERIGMTMVGIEIDPHPADYSKLLGQNRDHLSAMKMICKLITDQNVLNGDQTKYELTLRRIPEGQPQSKMSDFVPKEDWRKDHIQALTEDMFAMITAGPARVVVTDGSQAKTAVEVFVSSEVPSATVSWINIKLQPLYKSMGLKNGRIIAFNLIQDDSAVRNIVRNGIGAMR